MGLRLNQKRKNKYLIYMALTEVFWTFVISSAVAIIGLAVKSCLKANIDELNLCCGLFKVHRVIKKDDLNSDDENSSNNSFKLSAPKNNVDLKI